MGFDEFLDDRHPWLTEIAAEIRSLLREYGNERVHEQLRHWSEAVDAVQNEIKEFDARREAHFETHVLADARLRDFDAGAPAIGWNWDHERVGPDANFEPTYGWAPPELCPTRRPEVELPIPLPHDRNLTLPEQYAALAAIYDCCWKGGKVSPWPAPSDDAEFAEFIAKLKAGMHYSALLSRVPGIPATDEPYFRDNLLDVKDDWKDSAERETDDATEQSVSIVPDIVANTPINTDVEQLFDESIAEDDPMPVTLNEIVLYWTSPTKKTIQNRMSELRQTDPAPEPVISGENQEHVWQYCDLAAWLRTQWQSKTLPQEYEEFASEVRRIRQSRIG